MSTHQPPPVTYALPGAWVRVDVTDPVTVDDFLERFGDDEGRTRDWFAREVAAGAVTVLVRPRREPPTAVVFTWPEGTPDHVDADRIEHRHGLALVRRRAPEIGDHDVLTYALVHPTTGRCLVVRVIAAGRLDDDDVDVFDLFASDLTWSEV